MSVRISIAILVLLICSGVCHARDERWSNFAEDADFKYFMDQKSITPLPDNVYIFWVKSIPKDKDYFKKEYNVNNVSYMFTNYELDCAVSSYRARGTMMFDRNRKELSKSLPEGESVFEPVPPESMLELAQDEVCVKGSGKEATAGPEEEERAAAAPASAQEERAAAAPGSLTHPEGPVAPTPPTAPTAPQELPELQ
jgi:hypothetical protein